MKNYSFTLLGPDFVVLNRTGDAASVKRWQTWAGAEAECRALNEHADVTAAVTAAAGQLWEVEPGVGLAELARALVTHEAERLAELPDRTSVDRARRTRVRRLGEAGEAWLRHRAEPGECSICRTRRPITAIY